MADADRDALSYRRKMEEVRFFDVEHYHGALRGNCRGTLMVDYMDVSFKPASGYHSFRIPFKLLRIHVNGRSIALLNATDNKQLQSFKLADDQTVLKFKHSWDELKTFIR
jgi:hypothetical protein